MYHEECTDPIPMSDFKADSGKKILNWVLIPSS